MEEEKRKEPDGAGVMLNTTEEGGGSIEMIGVLWMSFSGAKKGLWKRRGSD